MSSSTEAEVGAGASIGFLACLAFAVGTMVGGGVFALSGTAINKAGPAAIASYLLAGSIMLLSALSFVAVAGRARTGESGYEPMAGLVGPGLRFLAMWGFVLNGILMIPFLLVSFGEHLHDYLLDGVEPLVAALVAIVALTALNFGSAELVGRAETYVVGIKIGLLVLFVGVGLAHVGDVHFKPFTTHGTSGMFEVTALLFTAYTGFNVVTNMAGSVKDPERTVPRAVIGSLLIAIFIYVGVVLAMLASGIRPFGKAGLVEAAETLIGSTGGELIAMAACLSTLSGANAFLIGTSEVLHRLAKLGNLPSVVAQTRHGHPLVSVGLIAAASLPLLWVDEEHVVEVANVAALAAMIVVNLAAVRLARAGWPGRGMRLPGGPTLPVIAAVSCAVQFPSLGPWQCAIGFGFLALGLVLYLYSRSASGPLGMRPAPHAA